MTMKLPGAEALGPAPSGRSGKPIASYDTTAIGRGAAQLGAGIASMGNSLSVAAKQNKTTVDKASAFETERRFLEFEAAQEKALQDTGQGAQPGAFGFTEAYRENYKKAAKDFFASVPDELKPEYDVKLFKGEDSLAGRANTFEREQRAGYYSTKVSEGLKVIEDKLYRNPKAFDDNLAAGNAFIDNIPDDDVSPIAKDALRREWKKKAQLASLNGMSPQERQRVLGAAPAALGPLPADVSGRATVARDHFVKLGWTPEQAAGIVGNLVQESGVRSDGPSGDNGTAHGMAQWRGERLTRLQRFAASQGKDWRDFTTQLNFVDMELKNHETDAYNALKSAKTIDEATAAFIGYERPQGWTAGNPRGGHGWANRLAAAQRTAGVEVNVPVSGGDVDPRFADMTYGDRDTIIASSAKDIADLATAQAAQNKVAYDAHDKALGLDIELGKVVSEAQIINDATLDDGDILKHLKALRTKQKDEGDVRDLVSAIVAGDSAGAAVNGFDADERKVGDKAYESMIKAAPEQADVVTESFVKSTGYIPKSVQAQIRQGVASTDPATLAATLSRADALELAAPISFGAFEGGTDAREKLTKYRHFVNDLGLGGDDAAQRIISMDDPAKKVNRDVLKPQVGKFLEGLSVGDVTNEFDPSIWTPEPGAGINPVHANGLLAEYKELAEEKFYETGGDAGTAKALALADIKNRWNVSNISGSPNLMRMPPELHYPAVDGAHTYLRDDAMETATKYVAEVHPDRKVENVAILPADFTRSDIEMNRPPRYRLFYQYSEDGQKRFDEVFGTPWGLDAKSVEQHAMTERQKAKKAFMDDRERNAEADEMLRASQSEADKILTDPSQPDWLKAMRAQNAMTLGEMGASDKREGRQLPGSKEFPRSAIDKTIVDLTFPFKAPPGAPILGPN